MVRAGILAVGIDPGITSGVFVVETVNETTWRTSAAQFKETKNNLGVVPYVSALMKGREKGTTLLAIEKFIVSNRTAMSRNGRSRTASLDLISVLGTVNATTSTNSAATVKTWANNERLEALGWINETRGMPHARDAARHVLYALVKFGGWPDPLRRKPSPWFPTL